MGYGVCQYVPSTEEPLLQGCWTIPHLQHGWMKERVEVRAQVKVGVHECNCATLSREWGGAYDGCLFFGEGALVKEPDIGVRGGRLGLVLRIGYNAA